MANFVSVSVSPSGAGGQYPVPHTANIPFMLTEGKEILVNGVTSPNANRFSINLCEGPTYDSNTALHFNPRFDSNYVVRTHQSGGWGNEETHGGLPFYKGAPYEVKIVVKNHAFQVMVNNAMFCEFNHRIAKETARYLYIQGDTSINAITFQDGANPPICNPAVPCSYPIPGGLYPGRQIIIDGVPNPGANRFSLNLMCGPSFDMNDIAFHFDTRFDQSAVVRTHKQAGGWGNEERQMSFFPFAHNAPFEVRITVEPFGYRVNVNNQHFADFNHRIQPFQSANHFSVQGDVRITQIRFQ